MKKRALFVALLVLCFLLAACGEGKFSIVGKWKSVGAYGFGQAQPGAIVVFDESFCNFFSPRDTYVFYQDGGSYKLETTSLLSTATLHFTVTVKDNDHIHVNYNGKVTELQRVQ